MKLTIHTDGGARGNPGPAAVGIVIKKDGKPLVAFGKTIGEATNNVAEYTAVIQAYTWILDHKKEMGGADLHFFLDSTLVVNQLNGVFKIKDSNLHLLLTRIRVLEREVGGESHYTYVPREQNAEADILVNRALDEELY